MCDEGSEDAVASDADYWFHSRREVNSSIPDYTRTGHPRCILSLHPGNVLLDIPVGKNPVVAQTFGNQFFKVHGNYPATDFRTRGGFIPPKHGGGTWLYMSLLILRKIWRGWDSTRPLGRPVMALSLIHIWRCRRSTLCRSRWSPYH